MSSAPSDKSADISSLSAVDDYAKRILVEVASNDGRDEHHLLLQVNCCHFPSSEQAKAADLLDALKRRLYSLASQRPYSIVILASPANYAPSTRLLVANFVSLDAALRKNVQKIYLYLSSAWWMQVLIGVFSTTLLSDKAFRKGKLVQCLNLSQLASAVGADDFIKLNIPVDVMVANSAVEKDVTLPGHERPVLFGAHLDQVMGEKDGKLVLPKIVADCLQVLSAYGPEATGVFRRPPKKSLVEIAQAAYERGQAISLSEFPDAPYVAASLLKSYIRSIPEPFFPRSKYETLRSCTVGNAGSVRKDVVEKMELRARLLLQAVCQVLHKISEAREKSLMTSDNLAICLCPSLVDENLAGAEDLEMCRLPATEPGARNTAAGVISVLIDRYDDVFDADELKRQLYEPPSDDDVASQETWTAAGPSAAGKKSESVRGLFSSGG